MTETQGADAEHGDRLAEAAAADQPEQALRRLDAVRHRHDLGQHRNVVRQIVRHPKDRRARQEVHVLRPAAEQMRRRAAMQAVAVVLQVLAHVVRDSRCGRNGSAPQATLAPGTMRSPTLSGRPSLSSTSPPSRDHLADILVAADQRIGEIALMRRAGILLALAAEGVLVGAADAGKAHLHDHRAGPRIRHRELVQRDATRPFGDGGANLGH